MPWKLPLILPCAEAVVESGRRQTVEVAVRCHRNGSGVFERGGTWQSVAMQPPDPLQEDVDGAKIGNQEIGVDVQRLLKRLCPNDDDSPLWALPVWRKHIFHGFIQKSAVLGGEAAVVERGTAGYL